GKGYIAFAGDEILIEEVGVTGKYSYGGKRINNLSYFRIWETPYRALFWRIKTASKRSDHV
ncbi:MAG: hypothetical protein ACW99Q_26200, partial [Candidatus Kariarchaeaceae archaeon]